MEAATRRASPERVSVPLLRFRSIRRTGGILVALFAATGTAAEPLHVRVDAAMDAARVGPAAPAANDAEFLRRAFLALTGTPPAADEARAFLADAAPDKRAKLIGILAGSREFVRHLAVQLDIMLMERRAEVHSKAADWQRWLEESLAAGKTWDHLVTDMISADGSDEKTRHVARWMLERQGDPNLLTRDAGRLFLGRDMGCAQCHDHPRIDDYAQRDYHGLLGFFGRTSLFHPDTSKPALIGESADGQVAWTSVFTKVTGASRPRLPGGNEIDEPAIPDAEKWTVAPVEKDKNVRAIPKYSRRARLTGAMVTDAAFKKNIANRLWGMVMGRCLVEPPDLIHSGNPPAHPAVMEVLADEVAALKFDLRPFIHEMALTKTFAQAFDPVPPPPASREVLAAKLPDLEANAARLKAESDRLSLAFTECGEAFEKVHHGAQPAVTEWSKAAAAHNEAVKAVTAATAALQTVEEKKKALTGTARVLREAAESGAAACLAAPEDKEIAAAAKTFQDKLAKTTAEESAADKDIAAKKAAAEAKAAEAGPAHQAAEAKKPAADDAQKQMAAASQKLNDADAAKQTARVAASQAAQRLTEAKALLAFAAATEAASPVLKDTERARTELASIEQSIAAQQAAITAAERELPALEKLVADTKTATDAAKQNMTAVAERVEVLAGASGKAVLAATNLPADAEVQAAAKTMQGRAEQAAKDKEAAQKILTDTDAAAAKAAADVAARKESVTKARTELATAEIKLPAAKTAVAETASKASAAAVALSSAQQALATVESGTFGVTSLTPLAPEPLCWSVLKVTGAIDQVREAAAKEWDDKNKPTDADKADPAKQAARVSAIEALTREKVKPHEDQFVRLFANGTGQPQNDFFATADQVLYFENAGTLRSWAQPSGNNLAARLTKLTDPKAVAEELYLSVLTRLPSADEVNDIAAVLASQPQEKRGAAISDAVWALLTTTEFRFRH